MEILVYCVCSLTSVNLSDLLLSVGEHHNVRKLDCRVRKCESVSALATMMSCSWPSFGKIFCCSVLCVGLVAFIGVQVLYTLTDPLRITNFSVDVTKGENIDFHRELASELADIVLNLNALTPNVNREVLLKLNHIIGQLDPSQTLSQDILLDSKEPDTCGEEFKGRKYGYPFYLHGFVPSSSCNKTPDLAQLVTAIFLDTGEPGVLASVLKGFRDTHSDIPVMFATIRTPETAPDKNTKGFTVKPKELQYPGKILNTLIKNVITPYVLLGINISYFNSFSRLERQIYVISSTNSVGIAGGAFRNESGHWKVGCHLSHIRNYFLKYTEGYQYSTMDCMFCDHLEGPFVAKTSLLQEREFKNDLAGGVVFEDWFLQVKQSGVLTMNCPDVMYFTQGPVEKEEENREVWLSLAKEWQVVKVATPARTQFVYSCSELQLTCDTTKWYRAMLIPTCCLQQVAGALVALDQFAKNAKIDYEIEAGTILGAVKLRSFLPWDKDGDITFKYKDYQTFYDNSDVFSGQGFSLTNFKSKTYFRLRTPDIILEMWGSDQLSTYNLPTTMWEKPTLIKMVGVWVRGEWNPGLFARNRYGPEYLKHVQHWGTLGMKDSWVTYQPGSWLPCPKKGHHACLDHYPTDGSVGLVPEE